MTKDEFEKGYAERSNVTVDWLHEHDQFAIPCDCGESECRGWQMIHLKEDEAGLINNLHSIFGTSVSFGKEVADLFGLREILRQKEKVHNGKREET